MAADQVFQLQGGKPLATGLDHILDTVADIDEAKVIDGGHVAGVQPARSPQLSTLLRLAEVAYGSARAHAVPARPGFRHRPVTGWPSAPMMARLHQWHRHAGLDAVGGALVFAAGLQLFIDVGAGDQRAGLRHAIGRRELNAARLRRVVQRAIERAAADDHFQAAEIVALRGWRAP